MHVIKHDTVRLYQKLANTEIVFFHIVCYMKEKINYHFIVLFQIPQQFDIDSSVAFLYLFIY